MSRYQGWGAAFLPALQYTRTGETSATPVARSPEMALILFVALGVIVLSTATWLLDSNGYRGIAWQTSCLDRGDSFTCRQNTACIPSSEVLLVVITFLGLAR